MTASAQKATTGPAWQRCRTGSTGRGSPPTRTLRSPILKKAARVLRASQKLGEDGKRQSSFLTDEMSERITARCLAVFVWRVRSALPIDGFCCVVAIERHCHEAQD